MLYHVTWENYLNAACTVILTGVGISQSVTSSYYKIEEATATFKYRNNEGRDVTLSYQGKEIHLRPGETFEDVQVKQGDLINQRPDIEEPTYNLNTIENNILKEGSRYHWGYNRNYYSPDETHQIFSSSKLYIRPIDISYSTIAENQALATDQFHTVPVDGTQVVMDSHEKARKSKSNTLQKDNIFSTKEEEEDVTLVEVDDKTSEVRFTYHL